MKVKVFQSNHNGKIEFTHTELEKLLNEVYSEGYKEGEANARASNFTWTSPYLNTPHYGDIIYTTQSDKTASPIDNLTCKTEAVAKQNNMPLTCQIADNGGIKIRFNGSANENMIDQVINELMASAKELVYNTNSHKEEDAFTQLAKELDVQ